MSKCQKNKYFNVGSQPCKTANPEFQGSLSKLLAERERQDSLLSASASVSASQGQVVVLSQKTKAVQSKVTDIDIILGLGSA
jgi:hypothetical protein